MKVGEPSPWPISAFCAANRHNTLRAAQNATKGGGSRCTCPHALKLYAEFRAKRTQRQALVMANVATRKTERRPLPELGDMRGSACRTAAGMHVMDAYADNPQSGILERRARRLCDGCPALAACSAWVKAVEAPRGSWQGIVAGMTRTERVMRGD